MPESAVPTVRTATFDDREAVWPLVRDFATSFSPEWAAYVVAFGTLLTQPNTLLCVAETGEQIIGYLLASHHLTLFANGPVCWVEEVMVWPEHRRTGAGRALMRTAEEWAWRSGARYVSLATRRAADFYRALGYEESAVFFKKSIDDRHPGSSWDC